MKHTHGLEWMIWTRSVPSKYLHCFVFNLQMKGAISARASNTMTVPIWLPTLCWRLIRRQLLQSQRWGSCSIAPGWPGAINTALGIPRESSCLECSTVRLWASGTSTLAIHSAHYTIVTCCAFTIFFFSQSSLKAAAGRKKLSTNFPRKKAWRCEAQHKVRAPEARRAEINTATGTWQLCTHWRLNLHR